ncbi:MAG: 3-phosphoshikimate 1-carboxyvinyltransferase [Chloroflexota bacterium]|nr:3-phosphoshikimate 1-carboxyvinyltransferase [Chloroflexota bacterium]MDE3100929.1 3-phosphoshikimate 1-carboxyvinyltransferase [Chloroflexota bacterium]
MPASKSVANRELLLSALAEGTSHVDVGELDPGDDVRAMRDALFELGCAVEGGPTGTIRITGLGRSPVARDASVNAGQAGTVARFVAAAAAVLPGRTRIDGDERMRARPMSSLAKALRELGATVEGDALPLTVAGPLRGGRVVVPGHESSQFASALLLAGARAAEGIELRISGSVVSAPFLDLTTAVLRERGVAVERLLTPNTFRVRPQRIRARSVQVPGDATAASYPAAAAAILGGGVIVQNVDPRPRPGAQGDVRFFDLLERMGCAVARHFGHVKVSRRGALFSICENVRDISDVFPTLAVVAAMAEGRSEILGVGHARRQESDRIAAVASGLRALGGQVTEYADGIAVDPVPLHGGRVDASGDHRIAMAFSVLGLQVPGVEIEGWEAVSKTYPGFYDMVRELGH